MIPMLPPAADLQPPVWEIKNNELTAAIASLSIGGAERIVLDWASRIYPRWKVHLIILRNRSTEWPMPDFIRTTRLHGKKLPEQLKEIGKIIAKSGNPVCLCHLLSKKERNALIESGVTVVPVLHNAKEGWPEDASHLEGAKRVITVSSACALDLKNSGWKGGISVIRHIPKWQKTDPEARGYFRSAWNIPKEAQVIGMIGAIKPQKNYRRALDIFKSLLKEQDAYLVILGGPVAGKGYSLWRSLVNSIYEMDLRNRVAMPGYIPNAAKCLPAFDLVLNTSDYEGLSIATLEAMIHGLPVVASHVGGQGEINHDGLMLVPSDAPETSWVSAITKALKSKPQTPAWAKFPAYRLWTLAGLTHPTNPGRKTLFITANLNSGGAQRSLVNLSKKLHRRLPLEILVTGNSASTHYYNELEASGVKVMRAGKIWDSFDFAEAIVAKVITEEFGTICFWNVDARIKLLAAKTLESSGIVIADISPGDSLFEEMDATKEFQQFISYTQQDYYSRLNSLVLKYNGPVPPECRDKTAVIPNGVPRPPRSKTNYLVRGACRIAVNGRIAPTKFTLEIISSMQAVWPKIPNAELHFFGAAEHFHEDYARKVFQSAESELDKKIFFHGPCFDAINFLPDFDIGVVLGKNQGCPNSLLEALSVGLPTVANDDGGTTEQLIHEKTGLLIKTHDPQKLAEVMMRIITDRKLARWLGTNGRVHALNSFSMDQMAEKYIRVLDAKPPGKLFGICRLQLQEKIRKIYKVISGITRWRSVETAHAK